MVGNHRNWNAIAWVFQAIAITSGLGFNHGVRACDLWWEAVIAVCVGRGGGRLDAWGGWVGINVGHAIGGFQGHDHVWQARFVVVRTVAVAIQVNRTCDWRADFTEQVTRGICAWWQNDARELVVADGADNVAVGVFTIAVRGWLGFFNRVCSREQVCKLPSASCIGHKCCGDWGIVGICACDGHSHACNSNFICIFCTVVVDVAINKTTDARGGVGKAHVGRIASNDLDWDAVW